MECNRAKEARIAQRLRLAPLKSFMPEIPASFTASRSDVIPGAATFPPKKKKYVSGRLDPSGDTNAVSGTPSANTTVADRTAATHPYRAKMLT